MKRRESGMFKCETASVPNWIVNDSPRLRSNILPLKDLLGVLLIINISKENEGIYECHGKNFDGESIYTYGNLIVLGKYIG